MFRYTIYSFSFEHKDDKDDEANRKKKVDLDDLSRHLLKAGNVARSRVVRLEDLFQLLSRGRLDVQLVVTAWLDELLKERLESWVHLGWNAR